MGSRGLQHGFSCCGVEWKRHAAARLYQACPVVPVSPKLLSVKRIAEDDVHSHPDGTPQQRIRPETESGTETDDSGSGVTRRESRLQAKTQQQLKILQNKYDELAASNRSYQSQINNNSAKLARKEDAITKAQQAATDAKSEVTRLKIEIKTLNAKVSEAKRTEERVAKDQDKASKSVQKELEEARKDAAGFRHSEEALQRAQSENEKHMQRIRELEQRLDVAPPQLAPAALAPQLAPAPTEQHLRIKELEQRLDRLSQAPAPPAPQQVPQQVPQQAPPGYGMMQQPMNGMMQMQPPGYGMMQPPQGSQWRWA